MIQIAKGGLSWISLSFTIVLLLAILSIFFSGFLQNIVYFFTLLFFAFCCLLIIFFRDPQRTISTGIVAVADGKIREITTLHDKDVGDCTKISVFMNIHNVHVNRMPLDGHIKTLIHHPGGHIPAFRKESERNERVIMILETTIGPVKIIQIAGTLARRIIPYVKPGDYLKKGEKIGLIRLGSRVDIFLPTKTIKQLTVSQHQKIKAGETTIAQIHD